MIRSLTAAGLGVAAKAIGLINQIVSITLISSALGVEGLRDQMLAISIVGWFSLTLCGMQTSMPVLLIRSSDDDAFAATAKMAFLLASIGGLCALGLTLLILRLDWIRHVGSAPVAMAAICNSAVVAFSLSERIFQATDRIGQFNILNMTGTLVSLAATFYLAHNHGTPEGFVAAYYLGMLVPFCVATAAVFPQLRLATRPSLQELRDAARHLIGVGLFGYGYEIAAYCKFQAPLALLSALNFSREIAPIGLGFRLVMLVGGGLTILTPILFLRIGTAIHIGDRSTNRFWTGVGLMSSGAVAAATAVTINMFGDTIYRAWTGDVVRLDLANQIALSIFAALALCQHLLFPLIAPDPSVTTGLRWMFWLEGPILLAAGISGAVLAPTLYAGAGMLVGAAFVMSVTTLTLLVFALRRLSRQGQ